MINKCIEFLIEIYHINIYTYTTDTTLIFLSLCIDGSVSAVASLPPHPSPCNPSYLLCSQPGLGSGPGSAHAHYYTSDIPQGRIFCHQKGNFWYNSKSSTCTIAVLGRSIDRILFMDGEENPGHASPLQTVNRRKAAGGVCCEWLWLGWAAAALCGDRDGCPLQGGYTTLWAHQAVWAQEKNQ